MKNSFLKQFTVMAMALILAVTMMPWNVLAAGDQFQAAEEQTQNGEDFETQKQKVIDVLGMMVTFFAVNVQDSVRAEIEERTAEMEEMTDIAAVGRKAYQILTDLIDKYPMKATTLDEWKNVVNNRILPVLDPDYFKESEQENVKQIREGLEKAIAEAKTDDDISSIQEALIQALVRLVQCDIPSEEKIHAIADVKAAYQEATEQNEDGSTMVPGRFFEELEEAYKQAIADIHEAETEEDIDGCVEAFSTLIEQMSAAESDEEFAVQKQKVIGVLMMMVTFFAEDVQAEVRAKIQERTAETEGMTKIADVARKVNEILSDLMAEYPMKATTLEEWKEVVTDKILPVLDPDYFKESDQERVNEIREDLETVIAEAETDDDISSIQTALIMALRNLMRCDLYDQYQILAISEVKGIYSGAIDKGEDGDSLVPDYLWDDLEESYKRTIRSIKRADSEEKAEECVSDFKEVVKRMSSSKEKTNLEEEKKKASSILRSIVNLYSSEDSETIKAIIKQYREKIMDAQTADEVWEIMNEVNTALIDSGVSPRFDNLDQWKEWANNIIASKSPEEYVVEDRAMVRHIITDAQKAIKDAKDAKEVQEILFGFARHLEVARDLEGYRNEIIKEVEEVADSVCKSLDYIDLTSLGDKAAVIVAAERVIRQVSNSVSAKEMKSIAANLDGIGLDAIKAWMLQTLKGIDPEKYVKEDREKLDSSISVIREKLRTVESILDIAEVYLLYQSVFNNEYTLLSDAVSEAAAKITEQARKAQADLTGDARYEIIQSELDALAKISKLESQNDLNAEVQTFEKKAGEIKEAAKEAAAKDAAAKDAAAKDAAAKAEAQKVAAQKEAEAKFVVKGKKLKVSSKKKKTFSRKKAFKIKNAPSSLTFKKTNKAGKGKIAVKKNGKVVVKKGLKKGTYKVKVRVTSKATANLKKITRNVVLKIRVK